MILRAAIEGLTAMREVSGFVEEGGVRLCSENCLQGSWRHQLKPDWAGADAQAENNLSFDLS
jgi:hypothetical protein